MRHLPFAPDPTAPRSVLCTLMNDLFQNIPDQTSLHFNMQVPPVAPNNYSIPHQQQTASTIPTTTAGESEHTNNGNSSSLTETSSAPAPASVPAPAAGAPKPKKKRANPVYITPVRKRERKRSCSDSDNEDGLTGDDCAWGPGGKRKKGGKKKGGGAKGKGKGRKSKKDDSDWTVLTRKMLFVTMKFQPSLYFCKLKCGLYFCKMIMESVG